MIRIELPERIANGEHVTGRVTWSAAEGKQARGLQVACGWRIEDGTLHVDVSVPPNTSATLVLPGDVRIDVPPGQHTFEAPLPN